MRRKILRGLCLVFAVLVMAGASFSAIPKKISFQGRLLTSAGAPVSDTNYSITFKIYDASSGGAALWTETQTVATTSGYYNVVLGSTTAITLAFDKDYWISVQVGADAEMSPRFYLGVAGYCINADTLDGVDSSSFAQLTGGNLLVGNPTVIGSKLSVEEQGTSYAAGYFKINNATNSNSAIYSGTTGAGRAGEFEILNASNSEPVIKGYTIGTGNLLQLQKSGVDKVVVTNAGNLLVGNPATAAKVSAEETGTTVAAGLFKVNNATNSNPAVAGVTAGTGYAGDFEITNATSPSNVVYAITLGTGMAGYFDINNAANGNPVVYGWTNGTGNAGYFGISNASSGADALEGQTNGTGTAVYGYSTGTGVALRGNTTGTGSLLQLQKSGVDKFVVANSGNVLVGNPGVTTAKVSAEETGTTGYAGYFRITNVSNSYTAFYVSTYGSATAGHFQILTAANPNPAVYGTTNGTGDAVYGQTTGTGRAGLFQIGNATNASPAVYGDTIGTGAAIYGVTDGTGNAGLFKINNVTSANSVIAGNTIGTGNLLQLQKSGVDKFVVDNSGNTSIAGNLNVTGSLTKGSGAFLIDNPLDPQNKVLRHSFVESPDMKNIYDGVVKLDEKGEAVVELPNYFEALSIYFRYQLTPIGGYAPLYIKQEISGNQFVIASANNSKDAGLKVSWQITSVRNDPYAQANPNLVEEEKGTGTAKDYKKGEYIHKEAYNAYFAKQKEEEQKKLVKEP